MKHAPLVLILAITLAASPLSAKPRSIVGDWVLPDQTCDTAIHIGPLSLKSDDVDCRFRTVKRRGGKVTWKGVCDDAEGTAQETVIATESDGRLTIRFVRGGNVLEDLQRCGE